MAPRILTHLTLTALESRDNPSRVVAEDLLSLPDWASQPVSLDVIETTTVHGQVGKPLLAEPRPRYAVASAAGQPTRVHVYDGPTNALLGILTPFDRNFTGGANVTTADLTGDGVADIIVAPRSNHAPEVRVFNGTNLAPLTSFLAYAPNFTGGVYLASGDVDGDGRPDIVTGAGAAGGPHVNVFSGATLLASGAIQPNAERSFFAYEPEFHGGITVAVADVNADGYADIITAAGPGGGPRVRVLSGADHQTLADFYAFDPASRTGVAVAAADFGLGRAQIAVTPLAGGPTVRLTDRGEVVREFTPFGPTGRVAGVAALDLDGDGVADLVAVSGLGAPRVVVLDVQTGKTRSDQPGFGPAFTDGLTVG